MKVGSKVGIVCCSNGQPIKNKIMVERLVETLKSMKLTPVLSPYIYEENNSFVGRGKERAEVLMSFYKDKEIQAIFDISGGDLANEVLTFLDFSVIQNNQKLFFGYSDLTTIINAIYAKTGAPSVLYQVRNLVYEYGERQVEEFVSTFLNNDADKCVEDNLILEQTKKIEKEKDSLLMKKEKNRTTMIQNVTQKPLLNFQYKFIQGESLQGVVVGGNIRCLLKLAGTPFWPDMQDKVLLLEARGGMVLQMVTFLNQLKQMGVFEQVKGILLGTFTKMEEGNAVSSMTELVKEYVPGEMPIVKTSEIGHGTDSKAIVIGEEICLHRE